MAYPYDPNWDENASGPQRVPGKTLTGAAMPSFAAVAGAPAAVAADYLEKGVKGIGNALTNPNWTTPSKPRVANRQDTAPTTPTAAIPKLDYSNTFGDEQQRSVSAVRNDYAQQYGNRAATTAALRGTNPTFDNAYISKYGYDRPEVTNANVFDSKVAQGMPGMNPATGVGGSAIGSALQAAAARGDWDAVNRYYASKGESFAGMAPPGGSAMGDLYKIAFGDGTGPTAKSKRNRAAAMLEAQQRNQAMTDVATLQNEGSMNRQLQQQEFEGPYKQGALDAANAKNELTRSALRYGGYDKLMGAITAALATPGLNAEDRKQLQNALSLAQGNVLAELMGMEDTKKGYADGGMVAPMAQQPVINPMGNMGMQSSMQTLDPAIRQYAQYVSTATQYGLSPLPFTKFVDLLSTARTQLAGMPTMGGQGYADGGMVDNRGWLAKLFGIGEPTQPASPQAQAGRGTTLLGNGMAGGAARAIQGRNMALEEALQAAQGARRGYAGGGAIDVSGGQVFGPGNGKSDSIPAVVDGNQPAALSNGEYVFPIEAVQFHGTSKLDKMVQQARGVK